MKRVGFLMEKMLTEENFWYAETLIGKNKPDNRMARYIAKNIVAAGLAWKCEIQLSYAIGVAHPTSVMVDTFGTGVKSEAELEAIIRENFDLRPAGIIKMLDLRRPIYKQTAAYGHFGRSDLELPWERTDKADILRNALK